MDLRDYATQLKAKCYFIVRQGFDDGVDAASVSLPVIPAAHIHGVLQDGHMLTPDAELQYAPASDVATVEVEPDDVLFFDAQLLRCSGRTGQTDHAAKLMPFSCRSR